ncbi:MAG: AmmeMemoRadiSam system radical SAM enzyme [Spirochaetaceae bacterium]|nr:MAG: AmmeMemoRadiSam system radical SAM enzyme [Spirochaetaceae bacterium]
MHNDQNRSVSKQPQGLSRRGFLSGGAIGACALALNGVLGAVPPVAAQSAQKGLIGRRRSPWFEPLTGTDIRCTLCPRGCRLATGRRGHCRVRENRGGTGYTLAYGNPCLVQLDPVERKPFFHVMPGTRALSVSTAGCPIECKFCEVWDMALVSPEEVYAYDLSPRELVEHALSVGAKSLSYAFGEPVAFFEYMYDSARIARRAGLSNLLHTSGYVSAEPLEALVEVIDAANVDLKGFDDAFYRNMCAAELEPVLRTLTRLRDAGVHLEITNLVIPTLNDDTRQIRAMCSWIKQELGPDVPLHFARFYPLYKLANLPPTPVSTLDRARTIAMEEGLHYVYVARVTGHVGENTFCPHCGEPAISRMGFIIEELAIEEGRCRNCDGTIPGRWA